MNSQKRSKTGYQSEPLPLEVKQHVTLRYREDELPAGVDLRPFLNPTEAQVGNSCVIAALVPAYEYLCKRLLDKDIHVSRNFCYYNARLIAGREDFDLGIGMQNAIKSFEKFGGCSTNYWPDDARTLTREPNQSAYTNGALVRIAEAEMVATDLFAWRHTLAEGYPIAFVLQTCQLFDEATRSKGRVPMPKATNPVKLDGWHAMLCVGYSDKDQMFIVRNSAGPRWGDQGYCYLPYSYVVDALYNANDSWIIKLHTDMGLSDDIGIDEEISLFTEQNNIQFDEFFVASTTPEEFLQELQELCLDYTEHDDDFYFDYEINEEFGGIVVDINNFDIVTNQPDEFLADLEDLCEEFAANGEYNFELLEK